MLCIGFAALVTVFWYTLKILQINWVQYVKKLDEQYA